MTTPMPMTALLTPAVGGPSFSPSPVTKPWLGLGFLTVLAACLAAMYWSTFRALVGLWEMDPNYSHGYLVPFISAFLIWQWVRKHPPQAAGDVGLGAVYVLVGGLAHLAAEITNLPPIDFVSMIFVLRGVAIGLGGREWANGLWFPLLFLFFMFPLPVTWTGAFANWLQDMVSRVTRTILHTLIVCDGTGNNIRITAADGSIANLSVAEECSGLRQIVAFVALAALVGAFSSRSWAYRVALMVSAVPAAVIANVARVLLMAFAARWFGTDWIHGSLHHAPVIVTLPLGLGLLLLFGWGLGKIFRPHRPVAAAEPPTTAGLGFAQWLHAKRCPLGVLALGVGIGVLLMVGLQLHLEAAGPVVVQKLKTDDLEELPMVLQARPEKRAIQVGPLAVDRPREWRSPPVSDEQFAEEQAALRARIKFGEDLFSRFYLPSHGGPRMRLYMVFSAAGEDRNHHPEICVGVALGWPELKEGRARIPLGGDPRRPVQRFQYDASEAGTYTVYYWYYTLDPLIDERHSLLQTIYLRNRRLPSLTVQVSTYAKLSEQATKDIEELLLPAVDREIRAQLLPEHVRMGCERLPIKWVGVQVE